MIKFFKNRFNIFYLIIVVLLVILSFRMAVLTIVEGQEYRQIADIKKIKDIPVKAPRGKIFDRDGVLLADNVSSFTVQMYTDEIKPEDFNEVSYKLSKILDGNMERPIDDFPIELDTFDYIDDSMEIIESDTNQIEEIDVLYYQAAEEKVIETVKESINEWLNFSIFVYGESFSPKQRVHAAILKDEVPIRLNGDNFEYYDEMLIPTDTAETKTENETPELKTPIQIWLSDNNLKENLSAEEAVAQLLINNNKYLSSLFTNSKIRKLSYEFIIQKGVENIKLNEFSFIHDEEYENIKRELNATNEEITINTSAKDDFVILTMKNSIDNLLKTVYQGNEKIKPGAILIDRLKEIYPDLPIRFIEDGETGGFEYTDTEIRNKYFNQQHMEYSTTAYDFVKEIAFKNYEVLYNLVTDDNIKYFSQIELLKYVNPSISIAEWEYTPLRNKKNWINNNVKSDEEINDYSAKKVFEMLRKSLEISEEINDYDMRNMMVLRERYNRISFLSYHPVDICYSISEKTVAMISERHHELNGINIEIEPLRYYPQYESASHIIGYLGKIAQDYELQEYVVDKGYSTDDIIGKTGLEEKFEDYLRGDKGKKTVEVNNVGRTIRSVSSEAPIPGDDLYLTMDLRLQKKAEESLKKGLEKIREGGVFESEWGDFHFKDKYENAYSGALVALDVKTNEVLALANYPAYDLNLFATGITTGNWNSLLNDSKNPLAPRPLYNIAMLTAIQPGSTFKMITSLAALEKGVNPNTTVYCAGTMKVGDRYVSCWIHNMFGGRHGSQTLYQAIMNSCNFYFYTTVLGENLATHQKHTVKVEAEDIIDMAGKFGLDSKTGIEIDIPQEASGGVPSIEGKKSGMRVYLRLFLEANLERYLNDGVVIDASMKNEIIEEIASWIDRDELMTRGEVYDGLLTLNLNPDKTNDNHVPLVDIIKYSYLNQATWTVGDNLNISIGQGNNAYTVLQMANYVSSIASGYRRNVSVIKGIKTYDGKDADYIPLRESEKIELADDSYLDVVKYGMKLVSYDDNAKPFAIFPVEVGSKTGTAENQGINPETGKGYDDFAWYVAFAPYDDPQIAVACVLFEGGSGRYPIPIVREVIGEYLKINGNANE
ncbi:MAG: penicillin-binding transpeptidase domain-containing protein [Tissierellia bacterium]|nr:penicillin-binding transpeptidase domain-containing protein [Tissierellia bacterium]MDD3226470.1 penicillin-binding transpeptidase domain-containing protein [Tissierellia bacterium]MDD4046274.1 penicillin-binding transpeptidase domain-containing protein [Tissierellia bacterium]MDD4678115.1 penicillin-binding transpeptidase domain-containing protein [Tissierellia bacterium]